MDEIGYGAELVRIDSRYFRPTEVDLLLGDLRKARDKFGWRHEVVFAELVKEMVAADLQLIKRESWRTTLNE